MAKLTRKQAEYLVAAGAAVDFLTGQRISTPVAKRINAALRRAAPTVGRSLVSTTARLGGTALGLAARGAGAARFVAMRHPAGAALGLTYVAVKNRDQIMNLLEQGYEIAEEGLETAAEMRAEQAERRPSIIPGVPAIGGRLDPLDILGVKKPKRRRSSYNKAVSSAMKAVKKSKFMGKPGKFSSPKKAFATVNRTVSKIKKGAKVGTKGVSGVIKRAVRKIL